MLFKAASNGGAMFRPTHGSLVADRAGKTTGFRIFGWERGIWRHRPQRSLRRHVVGENALLTDYEREHQSRKNSPTYGFNHGR